jgi:protein-disulfide isomerase
MPSGKRSKAERRAAAVKTPPPVRARGARAARRPSGRVLAIAGGVAALVVVGIVLGVVLTGGKSESAKTVPTNGSLANALPGASDTNALLKGIPQKGLTLGSAAAPVTLVEYIDLQCPFCEQFETRVMPNIINRYVRSGKLKVEAQPLAFIGPDSLRGRNAMLAAAQQNKAFNFSQVLYANQGTENTGWLDDGMVTNAATSIPGLNPRTLLTERYSAAVKDQASSVDAAATSANVTGTPTLFVGRTGSQGTQVPLQGPTDEASLDQAIRAALGG